jgi:hypothetical protein
MGSRSRRWRSTLCEPPPRPNSLVKPRLVRSSLSASRAAPGLRDGSGWATRGLEQLAGRLSPGSSVSFYFDGRLASSVYDSSVGRALLAIAVQDGDAVIGRLGDDQFEINVDFVASPAELEEYASELPSGAEVIYGRFPARDNDGLRAVTIDVPDRDGVVRPHPR